MAVYKDDKTGKWNFRVWVDDPITGKRVQRQRNGFELRRDALAAEANFIGSYENNEVIYSEVNVSDLIEEYLVYLKKKVKITTYVGYSYQIEKHITPYFSKLKLNQVTRDKLEEWYQIIDSQDYKHNYKNKLLTRLKAIFEFCSDQYNFQVRYLNTLPAFKKKQGEQKDEVVIYDKKTFEKFIEHTENLLEYTLLNTLFYTGLRIGELRGLTWNDIYLEDNYIDINKQVTSKIPGKGPTIITTKSESSNREVQIPNHLVKILKDWKKNRMDKVNFINKWNVFGDNTYIGENTIRRMVLRTSEAAGTPYIKLHEFRHSYTSLLYELDVDPKITQGQTGHSSIAITLDTYTHLDNRKKKQTIIDVFEKDNEK